MSPRVFFNGTMALATALNIGGTVAWMLNMNVLGFVCLGVGIGWVAIVTNGLLDVMQAAIYDLFDARVKGGRTDDDVA